MMFSYNGTLLTVWHPRKAWYIDNNNCVVDATVFGIFFQINERGLVCVLVRTNKASMLSDAVAISHFS
jgi:hypothetical protein